MTSPDTQPSIDARACRRRATSSCSTPTSRRCWDGGCDLALDVPGCPGLDRARPALPRDRRLPAQERGADHRRAASASRDGDWGALADGDDPRDALREAYAELRGHLTAREASTRPPGRGGRRSRPSASGCDGWPRRRPCTAGTRERGATGSRRRRSRRRRPGRRRRRRAARLAAAGTGPRCRRKPRRGQTVLVSTGEHAWTVRLEPTAVASTGGAGEAAALLAGEPSGRAARSCGGVRVRTSRPAATPRRCALLRERLAMAAD